jgi:hypothetical protein
MSSTTLNASGGTSVVVQVVNTEVSATSSGTTQIPYDDTIPQNTEGTQFMTLAITPGNASNRIKIDVVFFGTQSSASHVVFALFQDSTASALAATSFYIDSGTGSFTLSFSHFMAAGTTSATTFKLRAGPHSPGGAGTTYINGNASGRLFGGVAASSITITEYTP